MRPSVAGAKPSVTFPIVPCFSTDMKTFLKIVVIVLLTLLAIKLLPVALVLGCIIAGVLGVLVALGVSVLAIVVGTLLALALLLSPIWVPVLAVVGIVMLIKRSSRTSAPVGV